MYYTIRRKKSNKRKLFFVTINQNMQSKYGAFWKVVGWWISLFIISINFNEDQTLHHLWGIDIVNSVDDKGISVYVPVVLCALSPSLQSCLKTFQSKYIRVVLTTFSGHGDQTGHQERIMSDEQFRGLKRDDMKELSSSIKFRVWRWAAFLAAEDKSVEDKSAEDTTNTSPPIPTPFTTCLVMIIDCTAVHSADCHRLHKYLTSTATMQCLTLGIIFTFMYTARIFCSNHKTQNQMSVSLFSASDSL